MAPAKPPRLRARKPTRSSIKRTRVEQKRASKITNLIMRPENRAIAFQTLLDENDALSSYSTPSFPVVIELCRPNKSQVEPFLDECFKLIESTSSADYKAAQMGWHPKEKMEEMKDSAMMYLLVRRTDTASTPQTKASDPREILGFLSFMFTNDDPPHTDREVVYIYEVHLAEQLRGAGLGSHLVGMAEEAARKMGISKTMLTVFSSNKKARALYERLGYGKDACSPANREIRGRIIEADYIIMGKELVMEGK
ncbi:acyl-CoA N-acyltransferase [Pleomassaria siparia CBS 279.74]|uniref:N-alpha-acetyltransferase 40 n=1 Tax=Pleomassaria siparia CBS 279.74 TaxID=1314801 RepID=A0A6G1KCV1_9PLEO|nr:acyl-CoA N-acyltransferase [Pleomassaria siparia CBS 279.74]